MDVKYAFLNGDLKEVYIEELEGFILGNLLYLTGTRPIKTKHYACSWHSWMIPRKS